MRAKASFESLSADRHAQQLARRIETNLKSEADPALPVPSLQLNFEQSVCVQGIQAKLAEGHARLYAEAPTGWGKTVMVLKLVELLRTGQLPPNVLIVANDIMDVWRWRDEFEKHAPVLRNPDSHTLDDVGLYYSDEKDIKPITITTYESVVKLLNDGIVNQEMLDLIVLDEGHKSLSDLRQALLQRTNCVQLALSATPSYSREKSLDTSAMCAYECSLEKAEKLGLIAPYQQVVVMQPDVVLTDESVSAMGHYDVGLLQRQLKAASVTPSFIKFYEDWRDDTDKPIFGRQGLVNCLSIAHAEDVAREVNAAFTGQFNNIIPAFALSGQTPTKTRKWAISEYKAGRILMLCADELFVHGFDAPNVDFVFNMAPSMSGVKVGQRGGRARRIDRTGDNAGKRAIIVDVCYNNQSAVGWQLFYEEWASSSLYNHTEGYYKGSSAQSRTSAKQDRLSDAVRWEEVSPGKVIDEPDDLGALMEWRKQQGILLGRTLHWFDQFPRLRRELHKADIRNNNDLAAQLQVILPQADAQLIDRVFRGAAKHFNPDQFVDNWNPLCIALSKLLRVHVKDLFPIPDDWQGPTSNSPETREYLVYRQNFLRRMRENGFESISALAVFVGISRAQADRCIQSGQHNFILKEKIGYWNETSKKIAEALMTTPEVLFGESTKLRKLKQQWFHAAVMAQAHIPDPEVPYIPTDLQDTVLYNSDLKRAIQKALKRLTPSQEFVLTKRFGLNNDYEYTLEAIGKAFNIKRQRVLDIQNRGLRRLKHPTRSHRLLPYVEK